jgi:hypothetical protein
MLRLFQQKIKIKRKQNEPSLSLDKFEIKFLLFFNSLLQYGFEVIRIPSAELICELYTETSTVLFQNTL